MGSACWQTLKVDAAWTIQEHLTAHLVDILNGANWQRGGGKGSQPKPLPRPDDLRAKEEKDQRALAQAEAFLRRQHRTSTT